MQLDQLFFMKFYRNLDFCKLIYKKANCILRKEKLEKLNNEK